MTRLIEQTQPLLEQCGTAAQRATFFAQVAMRDAVRDHYVVAEASLATCQVGLSAALETGDPHLIGATRFVLGYCLFLSGQFEQAAEELRAALLAMPSWSRGVVSIFCHWCSADAGRSKPCAAWSQMRQRKERGGMLVSSPPSAHGSPGVTASERKPRELAGRQSRSGTANVRSILSSGRVSGR